MLIAVNYPLAPFELLADDAAENAFAVFQEESFAAVGLLLDALGHDGRGHDLRVGMTQGGARLGAFVLEDLDVAVLLLPPDAQNSLPVNPEDILYVFELQVGHLPAVNGRFNHNLMNADAVHPNKQPLSFPGRLSAAAQRRKFVGNNADPPARRIGRSRVGPKGIDLGRRLGLVPLAEGTESGRLIGPGRVGLAKIVGSFAPFAGDDHPPAADGVFSKLRHSDFPRFRVSFF